MRHVNYSLTSLNRFGLKVCDLKVTRLALSYVCLSIKLNGLVQKSDTIHEFISEEKSSLNDVQFIRLQLPLGF